MQTAAADLVRKAQAGEVSPDDAVKAVEGMIKRTENLKRKVRVHLTYVGSYHPFYIYLIAFFCSHFTNRLLTQSI